MNRQLQGYAGENLTGVVASSPVTAEVSGIGKGIHGIGITKNAGSNFAASIQVSINGVAWYTMYAITHATTILAFDLGKGWPLVRINITDDTGADVDLDWFAVAEAL